MAKMLALFALLSLAVTSQGLHVDSPVARGAVGAKQARSLLQTYNSQLNQANSKGVTPVTRVVNLLKEMQNTLNKEQEEDEALYKQLACWCNNNKYEKSGSSDAATAKISDLEATIEMLTARSKELNTKIKELETEFAADKAALAEATALRKKQLSEFHAMELDNIAALENLKSAIVVLGRHQGAAFPQMPLSLIQDPWAADHESRLTHSFDEFLRHQGFSATAASTPAQGFLQDSAPAAAAAPGGWAAADVATVKRALKSASAFMQAHHGSEYMPSYSAASGEIFGVLKQLQDEMKAGLSEAQQTEAARAATFAELRAAKTSEIESGEKMAETKEDELAKTDMDNAEAKEDLGQTQAALAEDQKFFGEPGKDVRRGRCKLCQA
jgi:septal ring factor EnvC (AmiA/AmiB activator)